MNAWVGWRLTLVLSSAAICVRSADIATSSSANVVSTTQSVVEQVEWVRVEVRRYLDEPSLYTRLEKLPDNVEAVMNMFASFGQLFVDGYLGTCQQPIHNEWRCDIYVEGGADVPLKAKAVHLIREMAALKSQEPLFGVLPREERKRILDREAAVFEDVWVFYDHFAGPVSEVLHSSDASASYMWNTYGWCRSLTAATNTTSAWDDPASRSITSDKSINLALHDMGRGCDTAPGDSLTDIYYKYAKNMGFKGGNTNKCFQNFVIRYNEYKEGPYNALVDAIHRYLLQTVSLYGMCLGFESVNATERTRRIDWVSQKARALSGEILKARDVFKEAPPTLPPAEQPRNGTSWATTSGKSAKRTHSAEQALVEETIGSKDFPYPQPHAHMARYGNVAQNIARSLRKELGHTYMVAVYFDSGDENECVVAEGHNSFKGKHSNLRYFVAQVPDDVLPKQPSAESTKGIQHALLKDKKPWCQRLDKVAGVPPPGIKSLIVVKYARRFVWYELAYEYFPSAAHSHEGFWMEVQEEKFSSACFEVLFFP